MNLQEIYEEWEKDSVIHQDLAETSRATPALVSKYIQLLSVSKLELRRAENMQQTLLRDKFLYYNGKMDQERLQELGWEPDPFNGLKIMKGEMDYYYNADPEIQQSEDKVLYHKNKIETLKDILDNLKWRHQTIKNIIDWKKFESGS